MTFLQHLAVTKPQSGISSRYGAAKSEGRRWRRVALQSRFPRRSPQCCKSSKELLAPIKPQSVFRDTVNTLKLVDLDPAKQNGCS